MELSMEIILFELQGYKPQVYGRKRPKLRKVRIWVPGETFAPDVLTVMDAETAQKQAANWKGHVPVLCVVGHSCEDTPTKNLTDKQTVLLCLQTEHSAEAIMNEICNIFDKYDTLVRDVQNAILQGSDLQTLVDIAEPFLRYCTVFGDPLFNLSAYTKNLPRSEGSNKLIELGYSSYETFIQKKDMYRALHHPLELLVSPTLSQPSQFVIRYTFKEKNRVCGYAAIFSDKREEAAGYYEILKIIFDAFTPYFTLKNLKPVENEDTSFYSFFISMLEKRDYIKDALHNQTRLLGNIPLEGCFSVGVLQIKEDKRIPEGALINGLHSILGKVRIVAYEKNLVIFRQKKDFGFDPFFEEDQKERFLDHMKKWEYRLGISREFSQITGLRFAYEQACTAGTIAAIFHDADTISYYKDYWWAPILYGMDVSKLQEMQTSQYVRLCEYDRQHKTNYTQITMEYIKNNANASVTSDKLYIHRNTVINVIRRVVEHLKIDIQDYSVRQDLIFAEQIERVLKIKR